MREEMLQVMSSMLQNNMGNRITVELASGLLTTFNQQWLELEAKQKSLPQKAES